MKENTLGRIRKLSDTIINAVAPKTDKTEVRRRPSYRGGQPVSKEDIKLVKPGDDLFRSLPRATSSDEVLFRSTPTPSYPRKLQRHRPTLEEVMAKKKPSKRPMMIKLELPPRPATADGEVRTLHATASTANPFKQKSKAAPVPNVLSNQQRLDILLGKDKPAFPTSSSSGRDQERRQGRPQGSGARATPRLRPLEASSSRRHERVREVELPQEIKARTESVYYSTGAATVRRHGAVRRTSSTGEVNQLQQGARYGSEGEDQDVTRQIASPSKASGSQLKRVNTVPPRRIASSARLELIHAASKGSDLGKEKPLPRNVPTDVTPDDLESDAEFMEPMPSSPTPVSPIPIATPSMVAKVRANMHVKESPAPRLVKVHTSTAELKRKTSQRAEVLQDGALSKPKERLPKRVIETYGMEYWEMERAQALLEEELKLGTPPPAVSGSVEGLTKPLVIRKGKSRSPSQNGKEC